MQRNDFVRHRRFGEGVIVAVEAPRANRPRRARVIFPQTADARQDICATVRLSSLSLVFPDDLLPPDRERDE